MSGIFAQAVCWVSGAEADGDADADVDDGGAVATSFGEPVQAVRGSMHAARPTKNWIALAPRIARLRGFPGHVIAGLLIESAPWLLTGLRGATQEASREPRCGYMSGS
jgi:hypothetical protein